MVGGYDTNGLPGRPGVTDEIIHKEVERMMKTYAPNGSYITMGFLLSDDPDPNAFVRDMLRISSACNEFRYDICK